MVSRKNILILMHNDATQFIDIANQYVTLFDKNKYKVTVAYLTKNTDNHPKNKTLSEEVISLNCSKKDIRGLKINAIKKLIALCRQEKFNLVISHRYKPIYIMTWVSKFVRIPAIIFVMHAMKTVEYMSRKLFIAMFARKNMYFAGVSDAVRDDLRNAIWLVPKERIVTLYNAIDMRAAENQLIPKTEAREILNVPQDAFIIGTVGRLSPEKDQQNIIRAFADVKIAFPRAKLLIIGDGPLEQDLKNLTVGLNLQDEVIFSGFVPNAQRYIKALDIFILASTKEAFGRVLLEAMIAKIPVIGTRTNGIPEVIGDAGFIVEARDSKKLSAAILNVARLTPNESSAMGNQGYERIKTRFSTDKFSDDFWGLGWKDGLA